MADKELEVDPIEEAYMRGLKDGMKQANKTMIDRACEWMTHNVYGFTGQNYGITFEKRIKEFRRAMKE